MQRVALRNLYAIGGSIGLTLPSVFVKEHLLNHGTRVVVTVEKDRCIIETLNPATIERLKDLGLELLLGKTQKGMSAISDAKRFSTMSQKLGKGATIK